MTNLAESTAIVTGGGAGIGRAVCEALSGAGVRVVVFDTSERAAADTVDAIVEAGGQAETLVGSVADSRFVAGAFADLSERYQGIDILINNAGISGNCPTLDLTDEVWQRTVQVNLDGVFYCAREAGRSMAAHNGGTIVNIGSIYALVAAPNRLHYCATKAAVEMLTRSLAIEWAELGIRVNGVAPGYVQTALLDELDQRGKVDLAAVRRRTPQKRLGTAEEVADAVLYLCEPRSRHITGQMLSVDGGWTAYGYI